jgi:hypothetical protein
MIAIERHQLDARARERWRVALGAAPIASSGVVTAESAWLLCASTAVLVGLAVLPCLWRASPTLGAGGVVIVALALLPLTLRAVVRRARRQRSWPNGRFLFSWGYAEIEDDVIRVAPSAELRVSLGRAFAGQPEVDIRGQGWRRAILIDPRDADRIAARLARFRPEPLPSVNEGYREVPAITGTRLSPSRWPPDAVLAVGVAFGALGLVGVMIVAGARGRERADLDLRVREALASQINEPYARAFPPTASRPLPHVEISLDACSPVDAASVARGIGVLDPWAAVWPSTTVDEAGMLHGVSDPAVRAVCAFERDARNAVELVATVRLYAHRVTRLRREARVTMEDALAAALACTDRPLPRTPAFTARAMLAYARAVIERDVLPEPSPERHRSTWALCISDASRGTSLRDVPFDPAEGPADP